GGARASRCSPWRGQPTIGGEPRRSRTGRPPCGGLPVLGCRRPGPTPGSLGGGRLRGGGLGGLRLVLLDHGEGDLAAGVDLADLHLDLLPHRGDVLDVVDPLAAVELAQLGDVQQAVLARGERDEGAEVDHAHDGAEVALADSRTIGLAMALTAERAASAEGPSVAPMYTVPSSSMVMSAPVSSWILLIIWPLGPMTAPILSTGTVTARTRGACGLISSGVSIASPSTPRIARRASWACDSAPVSTEAGRPSSLVSSWIAVTNSLVPATLKSMSPKASSAPRMSVRAA